MKIINKSDDNFVIMIPNLKDINFDDKSSLEDYFKCLFIKLKDMYNISVNGFYLIDIYIDDSYGVIIDVSSEDIEYFDYFSSSVDMEISKPKKTSFIYKVKDIFDIDRCILKDFSIYFYDGYYYLFGKLNDNILIYDFVDFEYKDDVKGEILRKGKLIEVR